MTQITPIALTYQSVLRQLADAAEGDAPLDVAALAKAAGKLPSNLRRDLPRLRAQGLITPDPALAVTPAGLDVLAALEGAPASSSESTGRAETTGVPGAAPGEFGLIRHQLIVPDELNPRTDFGEERQPDEAEEDDDDDAEDEGDIESLAASIAEQGLLQNLVVRPLAPMDGYGQPMHRLVAGERRWRAIDRLIRRGDWPADRLVPCRVVDMDDEAHAVVALLENLQRKKLKPLEEARAFRRLIDDFGMKTAEIAEKIAFRQRVVQQRLQLLTLDEADQARLDEGVISVEQARRRAARAQPTQIELSDEERFLMAELNHKWKHAPKRKGSYYDETECHFGVKDLVLDRLKSLQFIDITTETYNSEKTHIRRAYRWPDKVELPEIPEGTAIYNTAWLNGPYPIPAEGLKRLEEKKTRKAKERDEAKKAREAAAKLAAEVDWLHAQPLPLASAAREAFADQMKRAGSGWPWEYRSDALLVDGSSYRVGFAQYGLNPSLKRLLAYAVNAVGADQTQGRPATVACNHIFGLCLNEVLILRAIFELAGPNEIARAAELSGASEDEVQALAERMSLKEPSAAGDDTPEYLKRLAGAA